MAKKVKFTISTLPHEKLAKTGDPDNPRYGVIFGQNETHCFFCLGREEMQRHGITGHGPCINEMLSKSQVTILEQDSITLEYEVEEQPQAEAKAKEE